MMMMMATMTIPLLGAMASNSSKNINAGRPNDDDDDYNNCGRERDEYLSLWLYRTDHERLFR